MQRPSPFWQPKQTIMVQLLAPFAWFRTWSVSFRRHNNSILNNSKNLKYCALITWQSILTRKQVYVSKQKLFRADPLSSLTKALFFTLTKSNKRTHVSPVDIVQGELGNFFPNLTHSLFSFQVPLSKIFKKSVGLNLFGNGLGEKMPNFP